MNTATPKIHSDEQHDPMILRVLSTMGVLEAEKLEQLWDEPIHDEFKLQESIVRAGLVSEREIAQAYGQHYLIAVFDPPLDTPPPISPSVSNILPEAFCRDNLIAPLSDDGHTLEIAVACPDSLLISDEIKLLTQRQMRPMFAPLSVIQRLLAMMYENVDWVQPASLEDDLADCDFMSEGNSFQAISDTETLIAEALEGDIVQNQHSTSMENDAVSRYVQELFDLAIESEASDVHLEFDGSNCVVRMRVAGVLCSLESPPSTMIDGIVRRLKRRAKINISRRHATSEGEFLLNGDSEIRVRVRTFPSVDGEKIVMRIARASKLQRKLSKLGMTKRQLENFQRAFSGDGLVVFAGPCRSGKTTTLYSTIHALQNDQTCIASVESFVDLRLPGVFQRQVAKLSAQDHASAVRDLLYQDADVIVAADVEGKQTANVCVQAATMGRKVLMSIHANDAFTTIARMRNMIDPPSVLTEVLRATVAQHLLRRLCDQCKRPDPLSSKKAKRYHIPTDQTVYKPGGCDACRDTGYRGYIAVFEVLRFNRELRELMSQNAPIREIQHAAVNAGMTLMGHASLNKIIAGETSLDEALKLRYRA